MQIMRHWKYPIIRKESTNWSSDGRNVWAQKTTLKNKNWLEKMKF